MSVFMVLTSVGTYVPDTVKSFHIKGVLCALEYNITLETVPFAMDLDNHMIVYVRIIKSYIVDTSAT